MNIKKIFLHRRNCDVKYNEKLSRHLLDNLINSSAPLICVGNFIGSISERIFFVHQERLFRVPSISSKFVTLLVGIVKC